jgi:iron complex transport system ATP-binding protein
MSSALQLSQVSVSGRLEPLDLELPAGLLVGLIGPNGSGKSTLLSRAAGLLPGGGEVRWAGRNLSSLAVMERGRMAAWVPQEAHFEFGFTVRAVAGHGRYAHGDDGRGVEAALERLDLRELADRPVNQLSGGERHRVMLARALVNNAPLQFWDEPLSALDVRHGLEVLHLARELAQSGHTVFFSLHDLRVAHCLDHVVMLSEGRFHAQGSPEAVLTETNLHDVFGVRLRTGDSMILELP